MCSYLNPDFSFVNILAHFCPHYHTYHAVTVVFIHQGTLDSEGFFFLMIITFSHIDTGVLNTKDPWFSLRNRNPGLSFPCLETKVHFFVFVIQSHHPEILHVHKQTSSRHVHFTAVVPSGVQRHVCGFLRWYSCARWCARADTE